MSKALSFGLLYDFQTVPDSRVSPTDAYGAVLDVAAWSETAGFGGAWVPEHHLAECGYQPSAMVALGAIAARTRSIRLGSAIGIGPLHHPLKFAEDCAVLDILSGGRVEMALGIGYRRREYDAFGLDFTKRGKRFHEFLGIVRALWAGETVDHEGEHFTLRGAICAPPPPRGGIPLYIGGASEKALERAAIFGDGFCGDEAVCDLFLAKVREQGRDISTARIRLQGIFFTVARDPEKAMHDLAPYYQWVYNSYATWLGENTLGAPSPHMNLEQFKGSGILEIATPEQAVAKFKALQERYAIDHFMMMMPAAMPADKFVDHMQLFVDEVIPAFNQS